MLLALIPTVGISADQCPLAAASAITSLSGLPPSLRALLPEDGHGRDAIADRGSRFNATDVGDDSLPRRRFTLAAVAGDCAAVAIEYGGIARGFEITRYHLTQGRWQVIHRASVFREPKSLTDLFANL
jgi:hypothetical protein